MVMMGGFCFNWKQKEMEVRSNRTARKKNMARVGEGAKIGCTGKMGWYGWMEGGCGRKECMNGFKRRYSQMKKMGPR